jgi:hypothetical protein
MQEVESAMSGAKPAAQLTSWPAFVDAHGRRVARALAAAAALLDGAPQQARGLLGAWAFARDAHAADRLLSRLVASPPSPPADHIAAILGPPPDAGPDPAGPMDQRAHLFEAARAQPVGSTVTDRVAWGLEGLAWFGAQVERTERTAWQASPRVQPTRDAAVRALWSQLLGGDFWEAQSAVESLWRPTARRAFGAALRARGVPGPERKAYIKEFSEGFFWVLLGGSDTLPGWKEIAVRVLETDGPSGPEALSGHLGRDGWSWVVRCPTASSPTWRTTRAWALPDHPNALAESWRLMREGPTRPALMEHLLDGQVALRLLAAWSDPEPRTLPRQGWDVVLRHRTRTRGRLRAVLLETASDRLLRLLDLPGLAARTEQAVAAVAWARAHLVLQHHQVPSWDSSVTPQCTEPPALAAPLSKDDAAVVRTWVLLVVLRGRWDQLEHWARTGSWKTRPDSGWGRLLQDALPAGLTTPDGAYTRVQAHLCLHWPAVLEALVPVLRRVVTCKKGTEIRTVVSACWEPEVPLPSRVGAGARDAAQTVLDQLDGVQP